MENETMTLDTWKYARKYSGHNISTRWESLVYQSKYFLDEYRYAKTFAKIPKEYAIFIIRNLISTGLKVETVPSWRHLSGKNPIQKDPHTPEHKTHTEPLKSSHPKEK